MCEGLQVALLWPIVLRRDCRIKFAHKPFLWSNLAKHNAGVTVVIVGVSSSDNATSATLFDHASSIQREHLNPYLVAGPTVYVVTEPRPLSKLPKMITGSMPRDGGNLILSMEETVELRKAAPIAVSWCRRYVGSSELIRGGQRYCLWLEDSDLCEAESVPQVVDRLKAVSEMRAASGLASTSEFANRPHRFVYLAGKSRERTIAVAAVSSVNRSVLPVDVFDPTVVVSNLAFALYDAPLWNMALIASKLHLVWIATVCGKLKTDYRYSNTLGWNTFPVPPLTDENKAELTRCAENILLAREAHWPATIAELYDPETMPEDLRAAHDRNDETLERIYIGRRFKNDTERLETLFLLYTEMTRKEKGNK